MSGLISCAHLSVSLYCHRDNRLDKEIELIKSKKQLVETLIDLVGEDDLRVIVAGVIEAQKRKLSKLEQLSLELSGGVQAKPPASVSADLDESDQESAPQAVHKVLQEAEKPLGNSEIRLRIKKRFGTDPKPATIGNALWKGSKKGLYKKVSSSRGSRWTKWRYVEQASK